MSDEKKKKTGMNLPNKLTVIRMVLIVPFVVILLGSFESWTWFNYVFGNISMTALEFIALGIFAVASFTDMLDGKIARKYNLVTNFGKFMDPLADKLLVCSAMIVLVQMGRIPSWIVIIIISREFIISGFRLVASDNNVVIAASYWGKFKTTFQMFMIGFMIVQDAEFIGKLGLRGIYDIVTATLMWIALALTVISLADYILKNKNVMKSDK